MPKFLALVARPCLWSISISTSSWPTCPWPRRLSSSLSLSSGLSLSNSCSSWWSSSCSCCSVLPGSSKWIPALPCHVADFPAIVAAPPALDPGLCDVDLLFAEDARVHSREDCIELVFIHDVYLSELFTAVPALQLLRVIGVHEVGARLDVNVCLLLGTAKSYPQL